MTADPDMVDVLREALEAARAEVRTAFPARVETYDPSDQTATVTPAILRPVRKRDGGIAWEAGPSIPNVRVAWPRAGDWYLHAPLTAGDWVLVLVAESDLNEWRRLGGTDVDPGDARFHALSGAVALPLGLYPDAEALTGLPAGAMALGKVGGKRIEITDTHVNLGAGAAKGVARNGDAVRVTIPIGSFLVAASGGVLNSAPVVVDGTITEGSGVVRAVD